MIAGRPALPRDAAKLAGPLALRDGTMPHQRAIHADDAPRLQAFHRRLSRQTILFWLHGVGPTLSSELAGRLSDVDYENRIAVIATLAAYTRGGGFTTCIAHVIYDNDRMLVMLQHSNILTTLRLRDGRVEGRPDSSGFDAVTSGWVRSVYS